MIHFSDLKESKQKELLEAFEISRPEEMNWDILQVAEVVIPDDED